MVSKGFRFLWALKGIENPTPEQIRLEEECYNETRKIDSSDGWDDEKHAEYKQILAKYRKLIEDISTE